MITIAVDEKACVGCALCVDVCPTEVFTYDDAKAMPVVAKAAECFGCLSCAEICPATAIAHDGIVRSPAYYHDPYALNIAARLATGSAPAYNIPADADSRQRALADLGARLLAVAHVFKDTLGSGVPSVGLLAGRTLANQLPRYRPCSTLDEALALAKDELAPAWELEPARAADTVTVGVGECFIRALCAREKIELGGEMCVLFCNYLLGYVGRLGKTRLRLGSAERGAERCTYRLAIQA